MTEPRIYFGERPNDWVVVGARQPEFDYPIGTGDGTDGSGSQETTHWAGDTGIKLDSILSRLLFAARFRDLNLLISDQVTADSQLLMHRTLGERLNLIAPFLAYDKDPYVVVNDEGRLVWIQDAYTLTDRFPNAQAFNGSALGDAERPGRPLVQLPAQQRQDRHGRLRRHDDVLRRRPGRPADPGLAGRLPDALPADLRAPRAGCAPTSACRRSSSTSRPASSPATTSRTR